MFLRNVQYIFGSREELYNTLSNELDERVASAVADAFQGGTFLPAGVDHRIKNIVTESVPEISRVEVERFLYSWSQKYALEDFTSWARF